MSFPLLIIGPTSRSVRAKCLEVLRAELTRDGGIAFGESVLVFRNNVAAERAWRDLFRGANGAWLPRVAELERWFFDAVSLGAPEPIRWVTPADRQFILADLLPHLSGELNELRSLCRSADFVRQLELFIADLRRAGCRQVPSGGDWSRDLQTIVRAYDGQFAAAGGTDVECAPGLFAGCCDRLPRLPSCLVFDQITNPSPVLWQGMQALAGRASCVLVPFVLPGLPKLPQSLEELLSLAEGTILHRVLRLWNEFTPDAELIAVGDVADQCVRATARLLRRDSPSGSEAGPHPAHLTLTAVHTSREEIARIAAHIRASCDDPARLSEVTVVLPDPAKYAGIIEPAFAEHGVPVRVRRARPHSTYPIVRRLLRLFELGEARWPVDAMVDLFGDGLFQLCGAGHTLDPRRLRRACMRARYDNFIDLDECRQRMQNTTQDSALSTQDSEVERDLDCIRCLQDVCARLQDSLTVHEWADALRSLCDLTVGHLSGCVARDATAREAWQQVQLVTEAIDAIVLRAERWLGSEGREARDYFNWLRLELENATAPLAEEQTAAVEVVGPLMLNSGVSGTVYFGGLVEGDWPASAVPGTLVARHRTELAAIREHIPDVMQLAAHQLGVCLTEAAAVHLSYPNLRDGRETLRSPLLEDLCLLWPNVPALEAPTHSTSRTEVLARLGEWAEIEDRRWRIEDSTSPPPSSIFDPPASILSPTLCQTADIDLDLLHTLLHIRQARADANAIGPYDGALGAAGAPLVRRFYAMTGERPTLDSARLKIYAQCPLKFFYHYFLELKPPDSWVDDIQAYEAGITLHQILQRFIREYEEPLTLDSRAAAWAKLAQIAHEEVEKLPVRPVLRAAELCRLLGSAPHAPGGLLAPILDAEIAQRSDAAQRPAFAAPLVPLCHTGQDLPARLNNGLEAQFYLKSGGEDIQGCIDRIDVAPDGSIVAVIAYKTGHSSNLSGFDRLDLGLDFQLALYLLGARQEFNPDHAEKPALAAAYFSTRDADYRCRIGMTGALGRKARGSKEQEFAPDEFHHWLDSLENRIRQMGSLMRSGQFHLTL
ncbi:MAG: PD-(D/E)XK nuclease family protein, partial [Armatimonadota bacterium]|nr:PD-(D/E)XK nuclease family protein [Armatimonadota bacterium]